MIDTKISLNESQVRVLYEILNLSGVALTELDTDYGSDSIESIVQREPLLDGVNVTRISHRLFSLLGGLLERFNEEDA